MITIMHPLDHSHAVGPKKAEFKKYIQHVLTSDTIISGASRQSERTIELYLYIYIYIYIYTHTEREMLPHSHAVGPKGRVQDPGAASGEAGHRVRRILVGIILVGKAYIYIL